MGLTTLESESQHQEIRRRFIRPYYPGPRNSVIIMKLIFLVGRKRRKRSVNDSESHVIAPITLYFNQGHSYEIILHMRSTFHNIKGVIY